MLSGSRFEAFLTTFQPYGTTTTVLVVNLILIFFFPSNLWDPVAVVELTWTKSVQTTNHHKLEHFKPDVLLMQYSGIVDFNLWLDNMGCFVESRNTSVACVQIGISVDYKICATDTCMLLWENSTDLPWIVDFVSMQVQPMSDEKLHYLFCHIAQTETVTLQFSWTLWPSLYWKFTAASNSYSRKWHFGILIWSRFRLIKYIMLCFSFG